MLRRHYALNALLIAGLLLVAPGCFTFTSILKLNADGSGTIEERTLMSPQVVAMMQGFASDSTGEGGLFGEDAVQDRLASLGGVRLVRSEMISDPAKGNGYAATYAFDDVNTVRYKPAEAEGEASQETAADEADPFTFRFEPGSPATLTINVPVEEADGSEAGPAETAMTKQDSMRMAGQMQMMRGMLSGMRMLMAVEVGGTITETNATTREGNRVTLFELDMDRLMNDPNAFQAFMANSRGSSSEGGNLAKVQQLSGETDGLTVVEGGTVTIQFR